MFPILGWGCFGLGHFLHIFVTHVTHFLNLKHFTFILHHFVLIIIITFSHILICMLKKVQTCLTFVNPLEIGDLLHLFNNILHPHGGLIHLKIDLRDKTECSRFGRKIMYSNFERRKKLTTFEHSFNAPSIHIGAKSSHKGQRVKDFLFAPPSSSIKCLIKNYTKLKYLCKNYISRNEKIYNFTCY